MPTATASATERRKLTPPEYAKQLGVHPDKVVAWIKSGELKAMNASTRRGQRARYLIDRADIELFETARAVVKPAGQPARRKRQQAGGVTEYF